MKPEFTAHTKANQLTAIRKAAVAYDFHTLRLPSDARSAGPWPEAATTTPSSSEDHSTRWLMTWKTGTSESSFQYRGNTPHDA